MIAVRIAAILAQFAVADVVADRADAQLIFHIEQRLRQPFRVFARRAQNVKCDAVAPTSVRCPAGV